MKTLIFYSLMVCFIAAGTVNAQEITELEETKVVYKPVKHALSPDLNAVSISIEEEYAGEFLEDPLAFLRENFDIQDLIDQTADKDYDTYTVVLNHSKGFLRANFDDEGKMIKNDQVFRNILIPRDLIIALYKQHKGWEIVKNKYVASGNGDRVDNAFYKIKLTNGNETRRLKLEMKPNEGFALVQKN
ncbi:hypothetical protein [Salegentibacter chungangensis]|uniref:Nicotinate-nucleotide adenylyltransferase n=1 Tax=Salegentibacter chungangensis TaxID=1335724 RepID=A0ABW3NVV7_9FLAO